MQRVARLVARSPRFLQLRQASQSGISASFNPKDSGSLYERNSEDTMKINKATVNERWHASSLKDLEKELNALDEKMEPELITMKTILLEKLGESKVSTAKRVSILERFIPSLDIKNGTSNEKEEQTDAWQARAALREKVEEMYTKTMRECAMEGDWIAAEKLWNARGSLSSIPIAPSLALSYHKWRCRGKEELSGQIITAIRSNGQPVTSNDIYDLGEIFYNFPSSELEVVAEWLKMKLEDFGLEGNVVGRIKDASARIEIQELINGGRLDEAFEMMKDSRKTIGLLAIGQLMQAAIREENEAIIKSTFNLAASLHSEPTALRDLAFAYLLENDRENAESLFKNPTLKLSYGKIFSFIETANEQKRIDVIHSLFSILVSFPPEEGKVSVSELRQIATTVLRAYEQANDMDAAVGFVKEIEESNLNVNGNLKGRMDRVKDFMTYPEYTDDLRNIEGFVKVLKESPERTDPELVVRVLEELAGKKEMAYCEFLAGHVVNAALSNILKEKDVLSSGRIEKIIASKNIPVIRLDSKLIPILANAKNEESKEKAVDLVSRIVIASFKCKVREQIKSQGIIKLIGNSGITDEIVTKMVEKISVDPSVVIGPNDMKNAIEELTKRRMTKRAKLLGMLNKSQASHRWHASSFEDLENELNALEGKKEVKEVVLIMMKTILLEKLKDAKVSTAKRVSILERFIPSLDIKNGTSNEKEEQTDAWEAGRRTALRKKVEEMYTKTMRECAMDGDWIAVEKLWKARGSLRSIPISPSLALSYHQWREGEEELSRGIITAIRSNGQSVKSTDIYDLGEIFNNLTSSELEGVAEWLKKELSLEENVVDRIKEANMKRNIQELISGGRLDEAFEVMRDSQKAIGHLQLLQAAIREDNADIIKSTFNLAASLHSKPTAMLDLAFAFLLEDNRKNAEPIFKNPTLKLSYGKISFFIKTANEQKRIDVIHSLFSILVSCPPTDVKVWGENVTLTKVPASELNYIATTVLRAYEQANDMDAAVGFVKEIEESNLQVDGRLKERMDRVKNSSV